MRHPVDSASRASCLRGLVPWQHAHRGALLWRALRELVRHQERFALHLGVARDDDDDAGRMAPTVGPLEPVTSGA